MRYWVKSTVKLKEYDRDTMMVKVRLILWIENEKEQKRSLRDDTYELAVGLWSQTDFENYMTSERDRFKFEIENLNSLSDFWGSIYETEVFPPGGGGGGG